MIEFKWRWYLLIKHLILFLNVHVVNFYYCSKKRCRSILYCHLKNTRTTANNRERCGKFCLFLLATLHFISRDAIVSRYKSRVWKSPSREYPCDPSGKPPQIPTKRLASGLSSDRSRGSVPKPCLAKIRGTWKSLFSVDKVENRLSRKSHFWTLNLGCRGAKNTS